MDANEKPRGTKKLKYLDENVGSLKVSLTKEEERRIRNKIEAVEIVGDRYPAALIGHCFADTILP